MRSELEDAREGRWNLRQKVPAEKVPDETGGPGDLNLLRSPVTSHNEVKHRDVLALATGIYLCRAPETYLKTRRNPS